MKFVWITENYRVNIDSIFSLENRKIESSEFKRWTAEYNDIVKEYQETLSPLIDEDDNIIELNNESSQEDIEKYSKLLMKKIIERIGNPPEEFIESCTLILQTGLKVNITKDKYDAINKIIDENLK